MGKPYDFWLRASGAIATGRQSVLSGKTPDELLVMAETRHLLQTIMRSKSLRLCPKMRAAVAVAAKSRHRLAAPLMPLGAAQRIGWLDEATELVSSLTLEDCFTPAVAYRIACRTVPTKSIEKRKAMFRGGEEEVLVTGTDLLITIRDDERRQHAFSLHSVPTDKRIFRSHHLLTLTQHFHIPPAPDIATLYPARYRKFRARLEQFQK